MATTPMKGATARAFEQAVSTPESEVYVFRLCISGMSPKSLQAVDTLRRICQHYLPGRWQLDVIDIYQQPELAARYNVIATPTLIKELPTPVRRLMGSLHDLSQTLDRLGLRSRDERDESHHA